MPGARGVREDEVEIGKVVGVFGVRGEVRLHLHHRESDLFDEARSCVLIEGGGTRRVVTMTARSGAGRRVIGRIEGVGDRDEARALMGMRIAIAKSTLPEPEDGEFYVWAVRGLPVTVAGERVGEVVDVHATAGGDVLEVTTGDGSVFLPMVREVVQPLRADATEVVVMPEAWDA